MAESRLFEDTDEAAERVLIEGYQRLTGAEKVRKLAELSDTLKRQALAVSGRATRSTRGAPASAGHCGAALPVAGCGAPVSGRPPTTSLIRTLLTVAGVLDALGVQHAVCGSIAGGYHGVPRATMDADLVAELSR